jgi:hypothetical protein
MVGSRGRPEGRKTVQELVSAVAVGVFISASIGVGLRLLHLHRRTGDSPELLLGLMLLIVAGVGYPTAIAAQFAGPVALRPLVIVSNLSMNAGSALLFVFTWRVFRPEKLWARCLAGIAVLALCAHSGWRSFDVLSRADVRVDDGALGALLLMMLAYLWAAWESLRSHRMMRRRMRFGLGDAVVCDRFMLFGMMALGATAGVLLNGVAMWMGIAILENPWIQLVGSSTGLLQAGVLVLAFAPPRSYLDWVRARPRAWAS